MLDVIHICRFFPHAVYDGKYDKKKISLIRKNNWSHVKVATTVESHNAHVHQQHKKKKQRQRPKKTRSLIVLTLFKGLHIFRL